MARLERFELPTAGFEDQNSSAELQAQNLEPPKGYDPLTSRWQREILPLNYGGRIFNERSRLDSHVANILDVLFLEDLNLCTG